MRVERQRHGLFSALDIFFLSNRDQHGTVTLRTSTYQHLSINPATAFRCFESCLVEMLGPTTANEASGNFADFRDPKLKFKQPRNFKTGTNPHFWEKTAAENI